MDQARTRDLRRAGLSKVGLASAVERGELIRVRRGRYAGSETPTMVLRALRAGGRLSCLSELRHRGIWVMDSDVVHVRVAANSSRMPPDPAGVRRHWRGHQLESGSGHVSILDALEDASTCLERRAWIASVDSALHVGALAPSDLIALADRLGSPARRALLLVDRRAESGLESIVRVLAGDLGLRVRSQVRLGGVGRVDLIIENKIVVETDGAAFHDQALSARDRRRDAIAVAQSYSVLRPGYSLIVFEPDAVARQLIGAVSTHRGIPNSGRIAARARGRLQGLGLS